MVYLGLTPSICCLETFVHADGRPKFPLLMTELELPDDPSLYWEPSLEELPEGWNSLPADVRSMDFGTRWVESASHLGMIVPSTVVPLDRNMVVNPQHPAANQIRICRMTPFTLDERMAKLLERSGNAE